MTDLQPSQHRIRLRVRSLLILLSLFSALTYSFPVQSFAAVTPPLRAQLPSKLERQVHEWITRLAEQKPFKSWRTIDPQIEALGPGTHSWLVLFTKEGQDIGYMVVHAVTDGSFQLGEYGLGPYTLFSQQILKKSLIESGLVSAEQSELVTTVKHYIHPFAAAWEVTIGQETYWLDAKTAEQLPINKEEWKRLFANSQDDYHGEQIGSSKIANLQLNEPFDAYEKLTWLTKEAPFPAKDAAKLQKLLNGKQHLRYVTEPFGDSMLYAVPIIGYQRWANGRIDLAIDMEGTRFIPIHILLSNGRFYR